MRERAKLFGHATAGALACSLLFPSLASREPQPRVMRPAMGPKRVRQTLVTRASWYGPGFARQRTASGGVFDPKDLTGAHPTLPFGTQVRVRNLVNGRSVVIRITDRGPYVPNRGIDLSWEAARRLRMVRHGVVPVELELLPPVPQLPPIPITVSPSQTEIRWALQS